MAAALLTGTAGAALAGAGGVGGVGERDAEAPVGSHPVPSATPLARVGAPSPTGSAAAPPALAVRPLGGASVRTDTGARGDVRLEVLNGGPRVRLRSLTAEVPGVRFEQRVQPHGLELEADERVEVVLGFTIDDCAMLRRTGRLVLQVVESGVDRELGLTVTHDREAGTVRQVALDRVLGACPV